MGNWSKRIRINKLNSLTLLYKFPIQSLLLNSLFQKRPHKYSTFYQYERLIRSVLNQCLIPLLFTTPKPLKFNTFRSSFHINFDSTFKNYPFGVHYFFSSTVSKVSTVFLIHIKVRKKHRVFFIVNTSREIDLYK